MHAPCVHRHNVVLLGIGLDGDIGSDEDVRSTLFLVMEYLNGGRCERGPAWQGGLVGLSSPGGGASMVEIFIRRSKYLLLGSYAAG